MIEELLRSISRTIRAEFGTEYKIYLDSTEQGVKCPCFFIRCLNSSQSRMIDRRSKGRYLFNIQYLPIDDKYDATELIDVLDRLFSSIDIIDGSYLALNQQGEMVDNIINFSFNIQQTFIEPQEKNPMMQKSGEVKKLEEKGES